MPTCKYCGKKFKPMVFTEYCNVGCLLEDGQEQQIYTTLEDKLTMARDRDFTDAIKSLAGYKFWMFGYHASSWVKYNQLHPRRNPNPFKKFVDLAKSTIEADWR